MGTPRINTILDAFYARLGTISIANGYKTDVAETTYFSREFDNVQQRPTIGLHKGPVTYKQEHGDVVYCECLVYVVGHIESDTPSGRVAAVEALIDDVIAAVYTDYTWDAEGIDVKLRSDATTLGEPEVSQNHSLVASFSLEFAVHWDRTTGAS
jgi:hypothetical protein